ncbi:hypothetical protein CYFUS_006766 [Cystobacter fuscus]|uniref:Lipoprotein n=1 Tax=Cystobacter fuscus TaxID=43 RepID=A0A250JD32_9BACT|nr:DUF6184 family natural product biosynthesis lipoprotein [Cystobacter fuscus]ATB41301.1 hypothetical protein CYFUS_006766 [Cystobacter fuscus]
MNMNNWLWMLGVVGLMGCGVSSQSDAVTVTARNMCARYESCGDIGSGKAYANEDDCMIKQKADWNNRWSVAACDDHINGDNFDFCQDSIKVMSCDNVVEWIVLVADKCSRDKVCSGNP